MCNTSTFDSTNSICIRHDKVTKSEYIYLHIGIYTHRYIYIYIYICIHVYTYNIYVRMCIYI
jgi:hypothetical protein